MRASEAHEAVVNDDTVRRQSRRETERRSARTCSSRSQTCFYKRNMAAKFFSFSVRSATHAEGVTLFCPLLTVHCHRPRALVPELLRYPSAFPWGKGDRVAVDEGNLLRKAKRDNVQALRIMKSCLWHNEIIKLSFYNEIFCCAENEIKSVSSAAADFIM